MGRVANHQRKRRLTRDLALTIGRIELGKDDLAAAVTHFDPRRLGKGKYQRIAG